MKEYKRRSHTYMIKLLNLPALFQINQIKQPCLPELDKVARALTDAITQRLCDTEKKYIQQIETVRRELQTNPRKIRMVDYGAGESSGFYSQKEMSAGVTVMKTVSEVSRSAKKYFWALFLFKLLREFKPHTCVELGTNLGVSAAYLAAALKLNNGGRLITLEGAEILADMARASFDRLQLDNISVVTGRFQDTLPKVLQQNAPVDFVFVDGHHLEEATVAYFRQIVPFLSSKALLVFDDISWSAEMRRAWETIRRDDRVKLALKLSSVGICILNEEISKKHFIQIPVTVP